MKNLNLFFTIIGAHGLTDMIIGFFDKNMWGIYALYAIIIFQLPEHLNMIIFLSHSLIHFSKDIGFINSFLVSIVIPLTLVYNSLIYYALYFQTYYLLLIHVPLHYSRKYNQIIEFPLFSFTLLSVGHIIIYYIIDFKLKNSIILLTEFEKKILISIICSHIFYNDFYI